MSNQDAQEIKTHLTRLFSRCETECPEATFQLDRSEVDGSGWHSQQFTTNQDGIIKGTQWAIDWNKAGQNVYVGVNPRKPGLEPTKSATDKDIECCFFSFADLDGEESINIAMDGMPIQNTFTVNTGSVPTRRVHLYWEHETPCQNLVAWGDTQSGIANYFKGDRVIDPRRIMRLAGCVSYPTKKKAEKGYIPEIVSIKTQFQGEERDVVDTVAMYRKYAGTPASVSKVAEGETIGLGLPGTFSALDTQATMQKVMDGDNWHTNMARLTAHWVARGWSDAEIYLTCAALTTPEFTVQETQQEVMKAVRGARDKWGFSNPTYEVGPGSDTIASAKPKRETSFTVTPFSELNVRTHTNDFVENLLGNGQFSVVYGESNVGKTFFVLDLAFHVAMGWDWRSLEVEQGPTVYCALEGQHGITNRCAAIKKHYKEKIGDTDPQFGAITAQIDLFRDEGDTEPLVQAIIKEAERLDAGNIKLIIIDTLARALSGGEENSSEAIGAVIRHADRIREATGAHVMFVHHSGKDKTKGGRGHSSLRGAVDTELVIEGFDGLSCAKIVKQREFESGQQYGFQLLPVDIGTNQRGKAISSCIVEETDPPEDRKQGKRISGKNQKTIHKEIKRLVSLDTAPIINRVGFPQLPYCTEPVLREAVYRKLTGELKHKSTRFNEAIDSLVNDEHINRDNEVIWLC